MDWNRLAAISEVLSSVAILVTLIYLAIETEQNAEAIQASTRQAMLDADQEYLMYFADNPEILTLRYKPELTDEEKGRLSATWITFMRIRENNWIQHQNGVLDDLTWQSYRNSIVASMSGPRARLWWRNVGATLFDAEFASMVDDLLANAPVQNRSPLIAAFDRGE